MEQDLISRFWLIRNISAQPESPVLFWGGSKTGWVRTPFSANRYLTEEDAMKAILRGAANGTWTGEDVVPHKI